MMRNTNLVALAAVLALLACVDAGAGQQENTAWTLSGEGLAKLRAAVAAGRTFPEKRLVVRPGDLNGTIDSTQAVCGQDTSVFSSFQNVCKMTFTAADGNTYVCSAWIIAKNKLGTAGHCVIDKFGFIRSATVKCGSAQRDVTNVVTPTTYYNRVFVNKLSGVHWSDAGVLKVATPFPATAAYKPYKFRLIQGCAKGVRKSVTVAGYPADNSGVSGCHYNGRQQWKSKGPLNCDLTDGFYPSAVDSCGGGSGSRVVDGANYAIGIFTAARTLISDNSCVTNLVTRILDPNGKGTGVFMQSLIDTLG